MLTWLINLQHCNATESTVTQQFLCSLSAEDLFKFSLLMAKHINTEKLVYRVRRHGFCHFFSSFNLPECAKPVIACSSATVMSCHRTDLVWERCVRKKGLFTSPSLFSRQSSVWFLLELFVLCRFCLIWKIHSCTLHITQKEAQYMNIDLDEGFVYWWYYSCNRKRITIYWLVSWLAFRCFCIFHHKM